jgi:uncharacterized protein (UPF0276 family)
MTTQSACALFGIGVRTAHYAQLIEDGMPLPFAEAISENFLDRGGRPRAVLERVRRDAEVALHGVSLSIGSTDPLNDDYLRALQQLRDRVQPLWVSDHLCFGSVGGHYAHDLWPLPYCEEALGHVVERVQRVQDRLGQRILLENVSSYVAYRASTMSEQAFLTEVSRRADCLLLLDLNNVVVSAHNHGFDPVRYVDELPLSRVRQLHLGGHADHGTHRIDDHGGPVGLEAWALYRHLVRRAGPLPVIVEWDSSLPALDVVVAEAITARAVALEVMHELDAA